MNWGGGRGGDSRLAQPVVEPAGGRSARLGLTRTEIVPRPFDAHEVDPRIPRGDPLEHGEGSELVSVALDDERWAGGRGKSRLIPRTRPLRRRDRMAKDDKGVRRLALGKERRDTPAERAPHDSDALVPVPSERVACRAEVLDLGQVVRARPGCPRAESHRAGRVAGILDAEGQLPMYSRVLLSGG